MMSLKQSKKMLSWADQMEKDNGNDLFVSKSEVIIGDEKVITEYKYDENKRKIKVVRYYKIIKKLVSKNVAVRKQWKKFGMSAKDPPGPNPSTTIVSEEIFMNFVGSAEDGHVYQNNEQQNKDMMKPIGKVLIKCRFCSMEHWSLNCPYKDKMTEINKDSEKSISTNEEENNARKKYIPPQLRDGKAKTGEKMPNTYSQDDGNSVRVTNMPEEISEDDIKELFNPFGQINRVYVAYDRYTGKSKGFAFVRYKEKSSAAQAIKILDGYGYGNLILRVEWANK